MTSSPDPRWKEGQARAQRPVGGGSITRRGLRGCAGPRCLQPCFPDPHGQPRPLTGSCPLPSPLWQRASSFLSRRRDPGPPCKGLQSAGRASHARCPSLAHAHMDARTRAHAHAQMTHTAQASLTLYLPPAPIAGQEGALPYLAEYSIFQKEK